MWLAGDNPIAVDKGSRGPNAAVSRGVAGTAPEDKAILRFRLATIFAAQLFDFATFMVMVNRRGIDAELNPVVAQGFESGGFPGLLLAKIVLIVLVSSTIVILGRDAAPSTMPARLAVIITLFAVGAGVVGGFSNAITI
jgi:hypothetical protein